MSDPVNTWIEALDIKTLKEAEDFEADKLMHHFVKCIQQAQKRGIEWTLTFRQYIHLVKAPVCVYCGTNQVSHCPDRGNSNHGYNIDNTDPVCSACNMLKGCHTPTVFLGICHMIAENWTRQEFDPQCWFKWKKHIQKSRFYNEDIITRIVMTHPQIPLRTGGDCRFCQSYHMLAFWHKAVLALL